MHNSLHAVSFFMLFLLSAEILQVLHVLDPDQDRHFVGSTLFVKVTSRRKKLLLSRRELKANRVH